MRIAIVIPSYNESFRLSELIVSIRHRSKYPIIVVDDGSFIPETIPSTPFTTLLRHKLNLGKGAALKTGVEYAFDHGFEAIIMMDADGQHDPEELSVFVDKLEQGFDVIFGSRRKSLDTPLIRFLGNKFASLYIAAVFGVYISDILSGYRAFTKFAYTKLKWESSRYGVETEMVANLGKNSSDLKWTEIPIETIYIDKYKGVTLIDALLILGQSFWWKFR